MTNVKKQPSPELQEDWPAEVASQYQGVRVLGKGSFGSVTLARSIADPGGDLVAIKVIGNEQSSQRSMDHQYANREILILRELNHPNIVKILDSWDPRCSDLQKCCAVVAMSYAQGNPLDKLISHGGGFSSKVGLVVMAQVVDAVAYLHGRAVCHRDIKPANIVITCPLGPAIWNGDDDKKEKSILLEKYRVTLLDFGFARALSPKDIDYDKAAEEVETESERLTKDKEKKMRGIGVKLKSLRTPNLKAEPEGPKNDIRPSLSRSVVKKMSAVGTKIYGAPEIFEGAYEDKFFDNSSLTLSVEDSYEFPLTETITRVVANYGFLVDAYALGIAFKHMMTGIRPDRYNSEKLRLIEKQGKGEKIMKFLSLRNGSDGKVKYQYRELSKIPQPMADMIRKTSHPVAAKRMSVRECRRSELISSVLGETPESDEIDFLSFVLLENRSESETDSSSTEAEEEEEVGRNEEEEEITRLDLLGAREESLRLDSLGARPEEETEEEENPGFRRSLTAKLQEEVQQRISQRSLSRFEEGDKRQSRNNRKIRGLARSGNNGKLQSLSGTKPDLRELNRSRNNGKLHSLSETKPDSSGTGPKEEENPGFQRSLTDKLQEEVQQRISQRILPRLEEDGDMPRPRSNRKVDGGGNVRRPRRTRKDKEALHQSLSDRLVEDAEAVKEYGAKLELENQVVAKGA